MIDHTGKIGIGTGTPIDKLTLDEGNITLGNSNNYEYNIVFRPSDNSWRSALVGYSSNVVANDYIGLRTLYGSIRFITNNGKEIVRITDNERVGIGTTTPDSKLTVKGVIHAEEVKVDLSVPGPDYVFEEEYLLPSLEETKAYIDRNKHLPGIPSSSEMQQNGVNLLEMNMKLLEKVEELTLHLIVQDKKINTLEQKIITLEAVKN